MNARELAEQILERSLRGRSTPTRSQSGHFAWVMPVVDETMDFQ
jgi:hypothetical protein